MNTMDGVHGEPLSPLLRGSPAFLMGRLAEAVCAGLQRSSSGSLMRVLSFTRPTAACSRQLSSGSESGGEAPSSETSRRPTSGFGDGQSAV